MNIKLGFETVNLIDDGGFSLSSSSSNLEIHKIPPVLSIEV